AQLADRFLAASCSHDYDRRRFSKSRRSVCPSGNVAHHDCELNMRSEHNSYPARFVHHSSRGFSFVETMLVVLVMVIVLGSVVRYVAVATQRSKVEQTRVDLTQEAREFVEEFERDIHQAGYSNCNVINSGRPVAPAVYGGGLPIQGNVLFAGGAMTNDAYYGAVATFKDFPVFSAYDQNGVAFALPIDITSAAGRQALAGVKTVRLT